MPNKKPLVFLSHAAAYGDVAKRLKEQLKKATSNAFSFYLSCDKESIPAGDVWPISLIQALDETDIMFVLMSRGSESSQWIMFEAGYVSGRKKPVVPILFPGYPPDRFLPPLQWNQVIEMSSPEGLGGIVERLNSVLSASFSTNFSEEDLVTIFGQEELSRRNLPMVAAIPLASREELYEEIIRLVKEDKKYSNIRATSTLYDPDNLTDEIFDTYLATIARKFSGAVRLGIKPNYTLVMSFKVGKDGMPPLDRQDSIRNRQQAFEHQGVAKHLTIRQTPQRWSMDIFLLGDEHLVIGFPAYRDDPQLKHGIRISGREFVTYICQWFDLCVLSGSNLVDLRTLQVRQRPRRRRRVP